MRELSQLIRQKYELGEVMHMTHIDNLNSILSDGALFAKNLILQQKKIFIDISNQSVQHGRANQIIKCTGRALQDYVPLYLGKKTPMVSAIRDKNESLLFLMFSTNLLTDYDCVISDGNARSAKTCFCQYKQLSDLNILDPRAINSLRYASDSEIKRRKQAEILVLKKLPLKHLAYIVCHSNLVKNKVNALLTTNSIRCGVYIGAGNYYFRK
jgi:hypothetical protein